VEQLVARWAHNPKVVSSSLAPATEKRSSMKIFFYAQIFIINYRLVNNLPLNNSFGIPELQFLRFINYNK